MTSLESIHAHTVTQLAEMHDITPRRVRQYVEDGLLPKLSRGSFDVGWFAHLRTGEKMAARLSKRPTAPHLVAMGWLSAVGSAPSDADLEAFGNLFERNGFTRLAAMFAVGAAQGRRQ